MKLQDYAPYYIGCPCLNTWFTPDHDCYNAGWKLLGYHASRVKPYGLENEHDITWTDLIMPVLRRLEDMTEEEALRLATIYSGADKIKRTTGTVNNFFYFFCEFKFGVKGISEILIMHNGEAWYKHYFDAKQKRGRGHNIINQFDGTYYLLSHHFDLFGLIDAGLAVDAKTITQ